MNGTGSADEKILAEAHDLRGIRITAYCLMFNDGSLVPWDPHGAARQAVPRSLTGDIHARHRHAPHHTPASASSTETAAIQKSLLRPVSRGGFQGDHVGKTFLPNHHLNPERTNGRCMVGLLE